MNRRRNSFSAHSPIRLGVGESLPATWTRSRVLPPGGSCGERRSRSSGERGRRVSRRLFGGGPEIPRCGKVSRIDSRQCVVPTRGAASLCAESQIGRVRKGADGLRVRGQPCYDPGLHVPSLEPFHCCIGAAARPECRCRQRASAAAVGPCLRSRSRPARRCRPGSVSRIPESSAVVTRMPLQVLQRHDWHGTPRELGELCVLHKTAAPPARLS